MTGPARAIAEALCTTPAHNILRQPWLDPRITGPMDFADAAVLVAITDRDDEPGIILTRRSAALRRHAGQVSFPGGRADNSDADKAATALREAQEEIALPPHNASVIGMIEPFQTLSGFSITPVIAVVPPDLPYAINTTEVDEWFEVPVTHAFDPRNMTERTMMWHGTTHHFHEIFWADQRIWGITAAIIRRLASRLEGSPP